MTRLWFAWAPCAALAACVESTSLPRFVALDPILDSVFVGDLRPLPNVTYFDGDKLQTPAASAVTWQSSDPAILDVNNPAGQVRGLQSGNALVIATVQNVHGSPIVAVSDPVDITLLFHMLASHAAPTSSEQVAQVTLLAQVGTAPAAFPIDSISPIEATTRAGDATCVPPRAWASRSSTASTAYSGLPDPGQQLSVTQIAAVVGGGQVMSGRFAYRARRSDLYTSPLGLLRITGVFVAPLITDNSICP